MKNEKTKTSKLILSNIPNFLTISRIVITFIVIYMIFTHASLIAIVVLFVIGALTDFFDGLLARKFKWVSEFGRKSDMIADRFLWSGTALAFIISYGIFRQLDWTHGIQILLIMARELITLPFAFVAFFSGTHLPQARYIAKVTTTLQGFALPALILSINYPLWIYFSAPVSVACAITGFKSALYYINDTQKLKGKRKK